MNRTPHEFATTDYVLFGTAGCLYLNYNDVQCLDLAICYLIQQLQTPQPQHFFSELRDHHIRYLNGWLHNPKLSMQLYADNSNWVAWPVISLEDAKWLALALEFGINEETIAVMATDDAYYECDMIMMDDQTDYIDPAVFEDHYQKCQQIYRKIAQAKTTLLADLQQILTD